MPRKKREDMTPMERMEYIMKGATWDDAEAYTYCLQFLITL